MSDLPPTMKAIVLEAKGKPVVVKDIPTPKVESGAVIMELICAVADKNIQECQDGTDHFSHALPYVMGSKAVGRIVATGPDAALFKPGQLVVTDSFVRARDDPNVQLLWGLFDGGHPTAAAFSEKNWNNGNYSQYVKAPVENTYLLNEEILCGKMGYSHAELTQFSIALVPYGGFRRINLQAGERVVIAPATGIFSGAAVGVAVAMGANVIALGRNQETLDRLKSTYPQIRTVPITDDVGELKKAITAEGSVDVYLDLSPPRIPTHHMRACFQSLKQYGRAVMMNLNNADIPISITEFVFKNITVQGQYMYERSDGRLLVQMAEAGILKMGKAGGYRVHGEYKFSEVQKAVEAAAKYRSAGDIVVLKP